MDPSKDAARPALRRETLRDLTPDGAEATGVRGGSLLASLPPMCPLLGGGGNGTSGTISGVDCAKGRYWVDHRLWVEVEVLENLDVVVRRTHTESAPGRPLDDDTSLLDIVGG